ncbi:MAG: Asp23/Gls24 family envelope stress response protein [Chloroflexota bacterium]
MTEQRSNQPATPGSSSGATTTESDGGKTIIDDVVVAKIAAAACQEVGGIHDMGTKGVGGAVAGAFGAMTGGSDQQSTKGVTVEVGQREAIVNVNLIVDYGARIPQLVEALRKNVTDRVLTLTGLTVRAVNVEVSDVYFPPQQPPTPQTQLG